MDAGSIVRAAIERHREGKLQEAQHLYRQALAAEPGNAGLHCHLGLAFQEMGLEEEAEARYRSACALDPGLAEAHNNLGALLEKSGRVAEAESAYRNGISQCPDYALLRYNLGNALRTLRRLEEAAGCFSAAADLAPGMFEAHYNLGLAEKELGRGQDAERSLQRALRLKPDFFQGWNNFGILLAELGRFADAEAAYRRCLALNPAHAPAQNNLGNLLRELGRHEDAEECYRRGIASSPAIAELHDHLGNSLLDQAQPEEAERCHRRAIALAPANPGIRSNLLLGLNYIPGRDAASILAEHREFDRDLGSFPRERHPNLKQPERRLRVGYVSGDFRVHSVASFFEPLLLQHDRRAFEILCYYNFPRGDGVTARLKSAADGWREVHALDDAALADLIRRDSIDVLVDLSGHTAKNRLPVFARKPAPLQVSYLGYPATTGLAAMDYRLTDAVVDPAGQAEGWYTERLLRLPHAMWCFAPDSAMQRSPWPRPHPTRALTLGSFNYFAKLNDEVIALWASILRRMPDARLILTRVPGPRSESRLRAALERGGAKSEQIELHGIVSRAQLMELWSRVDIALDPFPYAGTTTTCDVLWMGIPVVSMTGQTGASRSGASLLAAVGLPELVAASPEQYVRIVESLSADRARLTALQEQLRGRMQRSILSDATGFARSVESALRDAWRAWCGAEGS